MHCSNVLQRTSNYLTQDIGKLEYSKCHGYVLIMVTAVQSGIKIQGILGTSGGINLVRRLAGD